MLIMLKEFLEILHGFRRVINLLEKREKGTLAIASVLMIVTGFLTNLPAVILGKLVDTLINAPHLQFSLAVPFLSLVVLVIVFREAITVVRKYLVENIATQTEKKQTVRVIKQVLMTNIASMRIQQIGSLHGRVFRSIQGLITLIKLGFLHFFPEFFSALAAIIIILLQKPLLASIMILVIPVGLLLVITQISSQKGIRVSLLRSKEKIDGAVVEMLGGIETVRTLNTVDHEAQKVASIAEKLRIKEIKHHVAMAFFDAAKYLNESFFYILVISMSILLAAQGIISKGDILVYSVLFLSITNPLREIHRILDHAHEGSIRVNDLYDLIHQPIDPSYKTSASHAALSDQLDSIIAIKNLTFSYQNTPHLKIIHDITLMIRRGEKIGIAGPSGCGKSTLVKILLRLVHNYKGTIHMLGNDLLELSREIIAEKIAYVPQNPYVFSGSVKENVIYGCSKKLTEEEIITALEKAHVYSEVLAMGGLTGTITENGNNLSGGQKQRMVLARLILKAPEILIFDEATSALDNTNEVRIQQTIKEIFRDKTIITIAHRLTTLKNSDRILVMKDGQVIQEGTYSKLANQKGLFQQFLHQREKE